jgi:hypothetical protein
MFDSNGFIFFIVEYLGAVLDAGCFLIRRRGWSSNLSNFCALTLRPNQRSRCHLFVYMNIQGWQLVTVISDESDGLML